MGADVVSVGVDYLTLTAKAGEIASILLDAGYELAKSVYSVTHTEVRTASISGYRGEQCEGVFYGEGEQGTMVRASSDAASGLLLLMGEHARRCNCPRVDIQVTGRFEFDHYYYAQQAAQKARETSHRQTKGRQSNVLYIDGGIRGATCSIGARSSARYIRIYDKSREQALEVDPNLWRWEVEYKPPLSPLVMSNVVCNMDDTEYIRAQVWAECDNKGVTPPWGCMGSIEAARIGAPKTSVERTLRWLRTSVAPTLRRLDHGGYTEAYMSALGLVDKNGDDSVE